MAIVVTPNLELPWASSQDEDKRFWRVLGILCVPLLLLSIAIPLIQLPEPKREELEKLPPQLARVVLEKKELPKPPPPPPPQEEKKPEEKKPEPKPEEKKPESKAVEPKKPEPEPVKLQKAIEQAKQSGVLAQMDTLADMRDALDIAEVKKPTANLKSAGVAETVDRNLIGKAATQTSGGINTAALSRDTGGVALSGRETTVVESKLEEVSAAAADNRQQQTREKAYRGDQAIRQKMEEAKGRIFGIYNRALRENPTLQGKVVFKLVIEPNGSVSNAQIVSSELNDADLERKLLAAVRGINFGASDVLQTTLNYSFDFLPY
jgi:Periplasmic protein TonB, links inner and outer membranes